MLAIHETNGPLEDEMPEQAKRITFPPSALDYAIVDRRGYWLTPNGWGEHAGAQRFDTLLKAANVALEHSGNIRFPNAAQPRPWDVTEGHPAVVQPCPGCQGTGRQPATATYERMGGWTEVACLKCWGYGTWAIIALTTVQFRPGARVNGTPVDDAIHLVRKPFNGFGGSPTPLLCGIDYRADGGPRFVVGSGQVGPGWAHAPCSGCAAAAREHFTGLPIFGDTGATKMAAAIGVPHRDDRDYERRWYWELIAIRNRIDPPNCLYPDFTRRSTD